MKQGISMRLDRARRLFKKFRNDPEAFFLDSKNPGLVRIGRWMARRRQERYQRMVVTGEMLGALTPLSPLHAVPDIEPRPVSVIIPVFNAPEHLSRCLESLVEHTSVDCRIIIIDDASTDARIAPILDEYGRLAQVTVLRNPENLGFTGTVNRGIQEAGDHDVLLLNSDTQVGPCWLQRLATTCYQRPNRASVTPLSNNAGAFSAPLRSKRNEPPRDIEVADLCRAMMQQGSLTTPQAPTGNGFCMYIRRDALIEVGLLDQEAFPRGYCEENDWSQRAMQAGWEHVVDGRAYVLHHQAASFGEKRAKLIKTNRAIIDERYPTYTQQVRDFMASRDMEEITRAAGQALKGLRPGERVRPRFLYVISSETGGTPQTNADLMRAVQGSYAPCLLVVNPRFLELRDMSGPKPKVLEKVALQQPIRPPEHVSEEYDRIIGHLLIKHAIELVHIRHLSWHSLNLPTIARSLHIPVVMSFHDFFMVCPNTQLLDADDVHCKGVCTDSPEECNAPLWPRLETPPLKDRYVHVWRDKAREVFASCDAFVTTSEIARDIFTSTYPEMANRDFRIITHGRDFTGYVRPDLDAEPGTPLRLVFPGNLNRAKGMDIITALTELDQDRLLEIHLLGNIAASYHARLAGRIAYHGRYKREDFPKFFKKIRPHFACLFSLWPETYCHTLTESWACGVPAIVTPFGALLERVKRHGGGLVLESLEPEEIYAFLVALREQKELYRQCLDQVLYWQEHHSPKTSTTAMAGRYMEIYRKYHAPDMTNQKA